MNQSAIDSLGFISAPALQQYVKSAEFNGLDRAPLLEAMGVSSEQLFDNNNRFACDVLLRLLQYVIPRCGNPVYGLQTSQFVQPGSYSILGYITMTSNNLGEALSRIATYEKLVGDMGTTEVGFEPGLVLARWQCRFQDKMVRRHVIENVIASWVVYARWIMESGEELAPAAVRFEHAPPENRALLKHYQSIFGCPVYFNQPMSAVVLPPAVMSLRLRQPDANLRDALEQMAQTALRNLKESFSLADQVRSLLRATLADVPPRKEFIAEQMGMHMRTLHRKLTEEGTTFQHVLDELRLDLASQYLKEGVYSVEEISRRLGFTESRSFIRYFKSHLGTTPGEFRHQAGGAAAH